MRGDNYIGNTTFDEVTYLYLFDVELKQTFFRAILASELHIKSIFAHRFAEHFVSIPEAYLDTNCYDPGDPKDVARTIQKLKDIISVLVIMIILPVFTIIQQHTAMCRFGFL